MIFGEKVEGTLRGEYTFLTYLLQTNNKKTLEQTKKKKRFAFSLSIVIMLILFEREITNFRFIIN